MASASTNSCLIQRAKRFPPVINGRINVVDFIAAATDLVAIVENLGSVFAPVINDMQGNIDKIKNLYKFNSDSCLLELMLEEKATGKAAAAEGILWLNRALLFVELIFKELIINLQTEKPVDEVNMRKIITTAYEGSVKKYHNWVTQQLFSLICKMSPNLPQLLKALQVGNIKDFETGLESFNVALHLNRCKIDDFFKDNNIINVST